MSIKFEPIYSVNQPRFDRHEVIRMKNTIIRAIKHNNTERRFLTEYCESKSRFRCLNYSLFNYCLKELIEEGVVREICIPITKDIYEYEYEIENN